MYQCDICDKSYVWSQDLKRHVKAKHPQVQEQECPESQQQITHVLRNDRIIECDTYIFHAPTTISISGTTGSGKTTLLFEILKHKGKLFSIPPNKIMYCYGVWQNAFEDMEKEIDFHHGIPNEKDIEAFADGKQNIIILDDLMDEVVANSQVQHLFTRGSHHKNLTIIYINQNMFAQGKCARTVNLNTHYLILLRNPRDKSQVGVLGKQIGLGRTLIEAYQDCTSQPYGYLLVDLSPHTDANIQLKTNIMPEEDMVVYLPQ